MKTTISIPDLIFEAAESLATSLGLSRNELFAKAIAGFIEAEKHKDVTARLNTVYAQEQSELNADIARMQFESAR